MNTRLIFQPRVRQLRHMRAFVMRLLIWHKTLESVCQIVSALAVLLPWRENFCFTAISLLCILSCATTLAEIILSERLGIVLDKAGEDTTWSLGWVVV